MLYQVNSADDRPIYAQIGDQVKFAVAAGLLTAGEMVPPVRELARQLVVNPNTVARAYRDLQNEAILEPIRGIGLQVSSGAVEICREARRGYVRRRLREALDEARRSNLGADEIEAILFEEWGRSRNGVAGTESKGGGR
jgi:GntR family transcriptional regulator